MLSERVRKQWSAYANTQRIPPQGHYCHACQFRTVGGRCDNGFSANYGKPWRNVSKCKRDYGVDLVGVHADGATEARG